MIFNFTSSSLKISIAYLSKTASTSIEVFGIFYRCIVASIESLCLWTKIANAVDHIGAMTPVIAVIAEI
jgi:hypothetical protein